MLIRNVVLASVTVAKFISAKKKFRFFSFANIPNKLNLQICKCEGQNIDVA